MTRRKKSDWMKLEERREARMWLVQVVGPLMLGAAYILSNPDTREAVSFKWRCMKANAKEKVDKIFKKKEETVAH